jgi:hypothetical protein
LIYSNNKISITILFTVALLTGFTAVINNTAYSIPTTNTNGLPGIADNPAFDLLKKGHMGDKKDTNSIDIPGHKTLSGKDAKFGHLTVIVNTIDLFNLFKQVKSSDFTVHVISDGSNQQSHNTFLGSEPGTEVKVGVGSYQVTEDISDESNFANGDVNVHFSQDCSGIMHNNEDKTCKITNTIQ